jgi:hypothetical protein
MATTDDRLAIRHLEAARGRLLARGDAEAVSSLDAIIGRLIESWVREAVGGDNAGSVLTIVAALRTVLARMADEAAAVGDEIGPGT